MTMVPNKVPCGNVKEEPPTEKPADDNVDESRMVVENEEREQEIKEAQLKMINSMTKILDE